MSPTVTRPSALVMFVLGSMAAVLALVIVFNSGAQAGPLAEEQESLLFTMEMQNLPMTTTIYPTREWNAVINIPGTIVVENLRPDEVMVIFNVTIDYDWFVVVEPAMHRFGPTRYDMKNFRVKVHIPPNTFGPNDVSLVIKATATSGVRDLMEVHQEVRISILSDVDGVIEGLSTFVLVHEEDRIFTGQVRIYNLLDVPQEFHICAMGEWATKIPDLDFQGVNLLNPQEQKDTSFIGHVVDGIEPGEYRVNVALWTPGEDGERIYILNRSMDMEIISIKEDMITTLLRAGVPILIIAVAVTAVVTYLFLKRRWRPSPGNHKT